MADSPATQECASCGALLDVSDEQPLALCHCPSCGAAMRVRRSFGPFELSEILGAGGMGAVYRAHDATLHRDVALKLLRPEHSQSQELIASFSKEAALTASINHPHVVKVYTTGTDHGVFYIAMELVDRGSLDELMALQGKIGEAQLLEVGIQVAQGLNAAAQRGLIHRDVKPGNILFADAHNAKIVDFGLAVLQEQANKDGGPIWGTPYYVAPEKLDQPPREDFRSDMYSLGATLFHAVAGRPPFEGETASMVQLKYLKNQLISIQSFVPELSRTTAHVIDKMLHRFPARRYASYADLITNLQYARDELQQSTRAKSSRPPRRSSAMVSLGLVALLGAGGFAAYRFRDRFFPASPVAANAAPAGPATGEPTPASVYAQALEELAAGRHVEAAAALRALDGRPTIASPLREWVNLHGALAFLLAGQPAEAQSELARVLARAPSAGPAGNVFFTKTAQLASTEAPTSAEATAGFDATAPEGFALLLLGVKNWSLGAFDEAAPLLARFESAQFSDAAHWLKSFQPIAARLREQHATLHTLSATPADDPAALQDAIAATRDLRAQQRVEGKFTARLDALSTTLGQQLASAKETREKMEAAADADDGRLLADALRSVLSAYAAFHFSDAGKVLAGVHCATSKRKAEVDGWTQRTEWLAQFKRTLINDINATGYAQPLLRRTGTSVENLSRASDANAEMKTRYGNVPVAWTDLTVESVAAVAQAFARTAPPAESAERMWRLGVFLFAFGRKAEGLALLHQAAAALPALQEFLPLFPES